MSVFDNPDSMGSSVPYRVTAVGWSAKARMPLFTGLSIPVKGVTRMPVSGSQLGPWFLTGPLVHASGDSVCAAGDLTLNLAELKVIDRHAPRFH